MRKPAIGRIVLYRTDARNDLTYDLPAIITVTRETHPGAYPGGLHNPLPIPESDMHVHLTVFSPGGFGTKVEFPDDFVVNDPDSSDFPGSASFIPGSGTYVEQNVPPFDPDAWGEDPIPPRTWRWPVIT